MKIWKSYTHLKVSKTCIVIVLIILTIMTISIKSLYSHAITLIEKEQSRLIVPVPIIEEYNYIVPVVEEIIVIQEDKPPVYSISLDEKLQKLIHDLCKANDISYELALGFFHWESQGFQFNLKHKNTDGTIDYGIGQINSRYVNYYHKLAIEYGELDPTVQFDPLNPEHGIRAGIGGLSHWKQHWKNQGISESDMLNKYMLNSYNMGAESYQKHVKNTGNTSRSYDREIMSREKQLIAKGSIDDK